MWKYLFFSLIIALLINSYLYNYWASVSVKTHITCLNLFSSNLSFSEIYRAFICDQKTTSETCRRLSPYLSLSGIHIFLFELLARKGLGSKNRLGQFLTCFWATALSFATLMPPTLVRAWLHLMAKRYSYEERLSWPTALTSFIAGALCAIFNPAWLANTTFLICWLASLTLQLPTRSILARCSITFVAIYPLSLNADAGHFLNSLMVFILKPVALLIFWPVALMVAAIPILSYPAAKFWYLLAEGALKIQTYLGVIEDNWGFSVGGSEALHKYSAHSSAPWWALVYVLGAHFVLFFYEKHNRSEHFWPSDRYDFKAGNP